MSTATALIREIPVDDLKARAREARPGRGIATFISAFFVIIGWIAGTTVTGAVFCCLSVRYGYRIGRGLDPLTGKLPGQPPPEPLSRPGKL